MMKKRFPPPPEVVQRARCYLALRLLRAYVDVMGKIRRWLGECEEMLERRPVSNCTDSEVIQKLEIVLSCIDCGPHKSPREQYTHWGAAIFCAHILLVDVRATCPAWYGRAIRRRNDASSPAATRGAIFMRSSSASRKDLRPPFPKRRNWERKYTLRCKAEDIYTVTRRKSYGNSADRRRRNVQAAWSQQGDLQAFLAEMETRARRRRVRPALHALLLV